MSPLMSASRLHFFLPLLCGGNTVRSVEEQERTYSPGLALWQLCDAPAGDVPDSHIIRDIISSSRCHLILHQHQHQRSTVLAYLFNLHLRAFRQLSTDLPTQHHLTVVRHQPQPKAHTVIANPLHMSHPTKSTLINNHKNSFPGPRHPPLIKSHNKIASTRLHSAQKNPLHNAS
jgi:hypothetical protein